MIKIYSIFNGAKYFFPDGLQNYLLFISTRRVEWINIDDRYSRGVLWRSTRMSQEDNFRLSIRKVKLGESV